MFQTLYKTATPEGGPPQEAEFYTLSIVQEDGKHGWFVREKHEYWKEEKRRMVHKEAVQTFGNEEGYSTFEEALGEYERHVQYRVSTGFVHSFTPDPLGDDPRGYIHKVLTANTTTE
jgi:hypothetical protein